MHTLYLVLYVFLHYKQNYTYLSNCKNLFCFIMIVCFQLPCFWIVIFYEQIIDKSNS